MSVYIECLKHIENGDRIFYQTVGSHFLSCVVAYSNEIYSDFDLVSIKCTDGCCCIFRFNPQHVGMLEVTKIKKSRR